MNIINQTLINTIEKIIPAHEIYNKTINKLLPKNKAAHKAKIRIATIKDSVKISQLYHEIYHGSYPDPLMSDLSILNNFLSSPHNCWVIAEEKDKIVGSVVYVVDKTNKLAKAFGAVIDPEYRGDHLTQKMMSHGMNYLNKEAKSVDVAYATTRTVTPAPQKVVQNLGYKMLGILPNVHKTEIFETHCLAAHYFKDALKQRFTNFKLHPKLRTLYSIVSEECGLPPLPIATPCEYEIKYTSSSTSDFHLEFIDAPKFVLERFNSLNDKKQLRYSFFPFHKPNIMIVSPKQEIEIFLHISHTDKYCVFIGSKKVSGLNYTNLLLKVINMLRDINVRYIEKLVAANDIERVEQVLSAKFIPCGYFPAMRLRDGKRYDFIVFSKSFEVFDFSNIKLEGINQKYLEQYFKSWEDIALSPKILKNLSQLK